MPTRYDPAAWRNARRITPEQLELAHLVLADVLSGLDTAQALRRHPLSGGGYVAKHVLVAAYRQALAEGTLPADPAVMARIRMKPVRSLSGVTTVTVLTEPYPCPGVCIFCPTEAGMPKSYLSDEPGAARAFQNAFDPIAQASSRLEEYKAIGHPTDKIELLILGGSWTAYPKRYQEKFVLRLFEALNGRPSETIEEAHLFNETTEHRNVGLVIETRPDHIRPEILVWLRRLGVTKLQMGAQSLDDTILALNKRGHTVADLRRAVGLARAAGFKIVLHWMPNLLGATPESDRQDFARLWGDFCPDELKIYPTQLLENSELYSVWQQGGYTPYSTDELIALMADIKPSIPVYCRVNRIIRDIPSTHVVAGNRRTSLRQDVMAELERRGQRCRCVRCREVRGQTVDPETLRLEDMVYHPYRAEEHFLQYVTPDDRLAGYLRLSLPTADADNRELAENFLTDLRGAAVVREVHVYGQSLAVGADQPGAAQHIGLGTQLLARAAQIARAAGYQRLAVIAAVGTRRYYQSRGFQRGSLYMYKDLTDA